MSQNIYLFIATTARTSNLIPKSDRKKIFDGESDSEADFAPNILPAQSLRFATGLSSPHFTAHCL
jgi:hypothetical protein